MYVYVLVMLSSYKYCTIHILTSISDQLISNRIEDYGCMHVLMYVVITNLCPFHHYRWHGSGGLLDYSNPEAVQWWHQQMDLVLNAGVGNRAPYIHNISFQVSTYSTITTIYTDGFKCDGTDPYILEYSKAGGAYGYDNQLVTYRDYADAYYRDFLLYTRQKRGGDNGLIMSRPVVCSNCAVHNT